MWDIRFHDKFVFRSPAFPFHVNSISEKELKEIANNKDFQEAIYIASPALFNEMQAWLCGELKGEKEIKKVIYSLHKYYSRISTRCTPYGLFATCSTGHWDKKTNILLTDIISLHARLDMDFVCTLTQYLTKHPAILPHLLFYPNNSLYYIGNQVRFVRYNYIENKRVHNISSAGKSDYLIDVLESAKKGVLLSTLSDRLVKKSIPKEDADNFIKELVDSQLLVSELEPNITGKEFIFDIVALLENINIKASSDEIDSIVNLLKKTNATLDKIGKHGENTVSIYQNLFKELKEVFPDTKENNLFQVDSFRPVMEAQLNEEIKGKLLRTINFLGKLANPFENNNLNEFKKRFNELCEGREVALLEILDTETGVGYPSKDIVGINELVDDLAIGNRIKENTINWNNKEDFLLKKLVEAVKKDGYSVNFSDDDIKGFEIENAVISPTMSIIFKVIDDSSCKIQFMNASGSSAANLLGRFAHGDDEILTIVKDVTSYEKEVLNDKIIAEIVHISESRIGNILLRPIFREYEIPYLAKPSVPSEFQIPISDIVASIKNNRIFLRSILLSKEILPRLSTAHNYSFNSLPAYKFLCDIQLQDVNVPGIMFDWGILSKRFKFLPRAEYENVILYPATWNFIKSDYEMLSISMDTPDFMNKVINWRENWKMPQYISLKDADNELLIDLENELSIKVFLDTVKKRSAIELVEFLFDTKTALVRDTGNKPYNNEIIAIIFNHEYKKDNAYTSQVGNLTLPQETKTQELKRFFIPGSEWLYYKIYCGVKTADKILVETIKPLVERLKREQLIEKWFFIRYSDPDAHIRIRFYNGDTAKNHVVSKIIYEFLNSLQEQGIISKVLTDTYIRELERYGNNNIETTEQYFEIESTATLSLLDYTERDMNEDIKWLYAMRSTDYLFDSFGYSLEQKLEITEIFKESYFAEHGGQKELKLQLDGKFRNLRLKIENFLNGKLDNDISLYAITSLLKLKRDRIRLLADNILKLNKTELLGVELTSLLGSYSHMAINRIFKAKQRTYEMVIYDMLHRFYKSRIARTKKDNLTS